MKTIDDLYHKAVSEKTMLNRLVYQLELMEKNPTLQSDIDWIKEKVDTQDRLIKIIENHLL